MGYKLKRILIYPDGVTEKQVYPKIYQWVEYIQSTGTQYIDIGAISTLNLKSELKLNSQYVEESSIFGGNWAYNGNFLMFYQSNLRWHSSDAVNVPCSVNTDYVVKTENGKLTVNGTDYTCTASSSVSNYNINIWRVGYNQGTKPLGRFKLYYAKFWQGTTLVRDLVPCYRIADDVIGMYDTVNNQFYTNSGTGTFIKGPDV